MKIAMVDVETTGLDPKCHRVIELGLQVVDVTPKGLEVIGEPLLFRQRIDKTVHAWQPKAFEVNGYRDNHPDWADAPMADTAEARVGWEKLILQTVKLPLCSQNVPFDRSFMEAELSRWRLKPLWGRRFVDIMSFSYLVACSKGLDVFGLHEVYAALGGPPIQQHRSMADIERGKFVIKAVAEPFFKYISMVLEEHKVTSLSLLSKPIPEKVPT